MNRLSAIGRIADPPAALDPAAARLRGVHRASSDLRRGAPVLLTGAGAGEGAVVALSAETGSSGLPDFLALSDGPPVLVLAAARAAGLLHRPLEQAEPVSLRLGPTLLVPDLLRAMADPTAEQALPEMPEVAAALPLAGPAFALAKIARLLPAVLVAPAAAVAAAGASAAAARLGIVPVHGADVLAYPAEAAAGLQRVAEAAVPLEDAASARIVAFRTPDGAQEHLAIVIGDPVAAEAPLVRLHSECFTGDLLGSLRCDCGAQLRGAIQRMEAEGSGVLLYLAQEGRGIGLVNKLRAYALQDRGLDTLDANRALGWGADERNFLIAATMLRALGVGRVRLLTNNPDKIAALGACGIAVTGRESHVFAANGVNDRYLATKAARFGHLL